jgi:cysteinyl-tRNA synthetase
MRIFNTLTREVEEFKPKSNKEVNMYVCGPTVYDYCHIGHARTWIAFDMIVRYLRHKGYNVKYIVNITDIDDKIIRRANEIGADPLRLAEEYELAFHKDLEALGLLKADTYPKVTEHINDITKMIENLISRGSAYEVEGDVYFDVTRVPDYGKLSNQSLKEMQVGARVEVDKKKRNPADFALWKSAKAGEPSWTSPWGTGRPGWHIECSVMSSKYLGSEIDIHGGGRDLIFPHHENEIAQSEAHSGKKPFVKYWIHAGFLTIDGEKMSKSLGNFITVRDLLEGIDPEIFKLMILATHYRSPMDYNEKVLLQSAKRLQRIYNTIEALEWRSPTEKNSQKTTKREMLPEVAEAKKMFYAAMDDDLNTSRAIASLFKLVRAANRALEREAQAWELDQYTETIGELGGLLGLLQKSKKREELSKKAEELIKLREEARRDGHWEKADAIREELKNMGVLIEDTPEGSKWRLKDRINRS